MYNKYKDSLGYVTVKTVNGDFVPVTSEEIDRLFQDYFENFTNGISIVQLRKLQKKYGEELSEQGEQP